MPEIEPHILIYIATCVFIIESVHRGLQNFETINDIDYGTRGFKMLDAQF